MTETSSSSSASASKASEALSTSHRTGHTESGAQPPTSIETLVCCFIAGLVGLAGLAVCEQIMALFSTSPTTHSPTAFIVALIARLFNIVLGILEVPLNAVEGVLRMVNEAFRTASIGDLLVFLFSWGFSYCMWELYCLGYQFLQGIIDEDARIKQTLIDHKVEVRFEEMRQKEATLLDEKDLDVSTPRKPPSSSPQTPEEQLMDASDVPGPKTSSSSLLSSQKGDSTSKPKAAPPRPPRPGSSKSDKFFPVAHRDSCRDIDCPCGVALQEWENMIMLKEKDEFVVVTGRET